MLGYIVKHSPDEDFYVYWSDIVDGPITWGPKEEVHSWLEVSYPLDNQADRWDRADEFGTSAFPRLYGWQDDGFVFESSGFLPRKDLRAFLETYDPGEDTFNELTYLKDLE